MSVSFGKWSGAVLPGNPPFDKVAALVLLIEHVTGLLEWPTHFAIDYWRMNCDPPETVKKEWQDDRLYPIDVGRNKYHDRKMGSATEVVAYDLGINLHRDAIAAGLVETANDNNRTGYLKGFGNGFNMPWTIRELYKPTMFVKAEIAVEASAHVVFTELKFRRLKAALAKTAPREFAAMNEYPALMALRKQMPYSTDPFTFPQYLYEMFVLGEDINEIERRINFWIRNHEKALKLNAQAVEEAGDKVRAEFEICGLQCVHIKTDDDRVCRALFSSDNPPAMVLAERRNGTFQILSNRRVIQGREFQESMREFYNELVEYEVQDRSGALWFLDDRIWAIMNGSRSLSASKPTRMNVAGLIRRMKQTIMLPSVDLSESGRQSRGPRAKLSEPTPATATIGEIIGVTDPGNGSGGDRSEAVLADAVESAPVPDSVGPEDPEAAELADIHQTAQNKVASFTAAMAKLGAQPIGDKQ